MGCGPPAACLRCSVGSIAQDRSKLTRARAALSTAPMQHRRQSTHEAQHPPPPPWPEVDPPFPSSPGSRLPHTSMCTRYAEGALIARRKKGRGGGWGKRTAWMGYSNRPLAPGRAARPRRVAPRDAFMPFHHDRNQPMACRSTCPAPRSQHGSRPRGCQTSSLTGLCPMQQPQRS